MSADDKHYVLNKDSLMQANQTVFSQKQKAFSKLFFAFFKSILNSKHLPRKDDSHRWYICGNTGSEKHD